MRPPTVFACAPAVFAALDANLRLPSLPADRAPRSSHRFLHCEPKQQFERSCTVQTHPSGHHQRDGPVGIKVVEWSLCISQVSISIRRPASFRFATYASCASRVLVVFSCGSRHGVLARLVAPLATKTCASYSIIRSVWSVVLLLFTIAKPPRSLESSTVFCTGGVVRFLHWLSVLVFRTENGHFRYWFSEPVSVFAGTAF